MTIKESLSSFLSSSLSSSPPPPFIPSHCPTILNESNHTIVVFQERGLIFNRQILRKGEAVSMTSKQTGGGLLLLLPYTVHATIGESLPSRTDNAKSIFRTAAIPAAFVAGCLATAVGAGMLAGPSVALAPLVSGMVVNGVVVDAAAIAAGGVLATKAQAIADMLIKQQPEKFMNKTKRYVFTIYYLCVW